MDSKMNETETPSTSNNHDDNHDSRRDWFQEAQTEPLNLCANSSFGKIEEPETTYYEWVNNSMIRRNPARAARTSRIFVDFADRYPNASYLFDDGGEKGTTKAKAVKISKKRSEEEEEWSVESVAKRSKKKKREEKQ